MLLDNKIKNILVVSQHNQIGDMICSLPLFSALKKKFSQAEITLAASKTNYKIPFNDINPYLDNVIVFDKSSSKTLIFFLKELRKVRYQIGVVPSTIKISRTSHIINYFAGAKTRIGVKSIDNKINPSAYLLNIKSIFNWDTDKVHQRERNLDVVRQIGCDLSDNEINDNKINLSVEDYKFAEDFISEKFPDKNKLIVGFHPGAGKEKNIWKEGNFINLIKYIYETHQPYIYITCGWTDSINQIVKELTNLKINFEILQNYHVKKLVALFNKSDLYITNDTGTMHIGGMTNVNQISLFGPTNPWEWAPKGESKFYIKSKSDDIDDINVDEVISLSNKILLKELQNES